DHARLQLRQGVQSRGLDALPQPPPDRRICVRAEVEAVVPEDALEQQLDLYPLQLRAVAGRRPRHVARRNGCTRDGKGIGDNRRFPFLLLQPSFLSQRYSHTLMRLRSCSVSTGLVM